MLGSAHLAHDHFRRTGYLLLRRVVDAEAVTELRCLVLDQLERAVQPCSGEAVGRMDRLDALHARHSAFRRVIQHPVLLDALETLLGPNIVLVTNRHNHATALYSTNKGTRLHRDILQWSRPLVNALVYLDKADPMSGATRLVPGSHWLRCGGKPSNGGTWLDEQDSYAPLIQQALHINVAAGDVLLLDSLTYHAAGTNVGNRPRVVIALSYRAADELAPPGSEIGHTLLVHGEDLYRGNPAGTA
jgi:ectoine hydroxylase-related dioxygenase (phytanoyl-CoA dioxygenase family)